MLRIARGFRNVEDSALIPNAASTSGLALTARALSTTIVQGKVLPSTMQPERKLFPRLGVYQCPEQIVFWRWLAPRLLALICAQAQGLQFSPSTP